MKGCKCGAIQITDAGWRQMSPQQRSTAEKAIRDCETCKRDRRLGHDHR